MDKKILAAVAVVIVVAAAASAYVILNNNEEKTDYTLLDKLDDMKAGFVVDMKETSKDVNAHMGFKVIKVEGKDYTVETIYDEDLTEEDYPEYKMNGFKPSSFKDRYGYDYTDTANLPDTVKVTVDGNRYTINGKYTFTETGITINSDLTNLTITLADGNVTKLEGKVKYDTKNADGTEAVEATMTFTPKDDGKIEAKEHGINKSTMNETLDNLKNSFQKYDASKYEGTEITESTEKCGNVDAKVYTVNGTAHGTTYDNLKIYTYHDYLIKQTGKIGGTEGTAVISVYYE